MNDEDKRDPVGWDETLGEHAANPPIPRRTGEHFIVMEVCPDCQGVGKDDNEEKCQSCFGACHTGEVEIDWVVSPDEARIKAQFESYLKHNAEMVIAEKAGYPEEADRLRSVYIAERAAGSYTWDGFACRKARGDFPGISHLFFLFVRRCHPDVTYKEVRNVCRKHWEQVLRTVGACLGNWESPTKEAPMSSKAKRMPTKSPQQEPTGSGWSGKKDAVVTTEELILTGREPTEAQVKRAQRELMQRAPATIDGNS